MPKPFLSFLTLSLLSASVSVAAFAADRMKPGLWEMTIKSDAMKAMPKLSAEQMEQMRKMGMNVPQIQDGGMVSKVCVTKEIAERDEPLDADAKEMGCQSKNFQRSGNGYSAEIVCNGALMKGEGKAKGTYSGNDSYTATYDFKGTMHGQPVTQHSETRGKWLSADCGNVKPVADFARKK
ncbi:DUF3617 domain-containing protein [Noviherbaspirillum cavernae]|uniref:DUF3617 domain-containing protein n=1 Tax=Noviherbaspirillum cavernae TaxID=2320862 RepID=A0A418X337_9BURK|nr:DUF3617 domain-containing protein [Noviherbaspirillum cavernae]RJG06870.1 DUF3617 domain-containing protein [Noviherbaspirillum cavernae]